MAWSSLDFSDSLRRFAVAILAYSSLFDIKRNLVFYAILLLSICWLLALLWDFVRNFPALEKSGVVRK